ncbi:hypothetical protein D3C84_644050 [compost metagenome]
MHRGIDISATAHDFPVHLVPQAGSEMTVQKLIGLHIQHSQMFKTALFQGDAAVLGVDHFALPVRAAAT